MPIQYQIEPAKRWLRATVTGDVPLAEMLDAVDRSARDPAFEDGFAVLSDHTGITRAISVEELHQVAARLESLSGRIGGTRWAIVTQRPESYGMMRMLAVYAERIPMEVRVFRSATEAEGWLASPRSPRAEPGR